MISSSLVGTSLLIVASLLLLPALLPAWLVRGLKIHSTTAYSITIHASRLVAIILSFAFVWLGYNFSITDLSLLLVYQHSHSLKPLIYKISGTWGNHEGSMLLIAVIMAFYTAFYSRRTSLMKQQDSWQIYHHTALRILNMLLLGLMGFILLTSNPFAPNPFPVTEGQGLNPLLQDIGLALHPPMLYLGYIGLAVPFALGFSALLHQSRSLYFTHHLHYYSLISWSFLTLGIGLGSWWAYRELGWGGFWFWDPVENASLMPWLLATALIHTALASRKSSFLWLWTLLLALMAFCLSLMGLFLVRSGILTSVHSFANDPGRGFYILLFTGMVTLSSLLLFSVRAKNLLHQQSLSYISREAMILIGSMVITVSCATILLGTLYPMLLELTIQKSISVGAPYFNKTFNYLGLLILIGTALTPLLRWGQQSSDSSLIQTSASRQFGLGFNIIAMLLIAIIPTYASYHWLGIHSVISGLGIGIASLLMVSIGWKIKKQQRIRFKHCALIFGHLGIALIALALSFHADLAWEQERYMQPNDRIEFADYSLSLRQLDPIFVDNYIGQRGQFLLSHPSKQSIILQPEYRYYPVEKQHTTETAIYSHLFYDIYVAIGEQSDQGIAVRLYYQPMVSFLWIGCVVMALGGFIAANNRRQQTNRHST